MNPRDRWRFANGAWNRSVTGPALRWPSATNAIDRAGMRNHAAVARARLGALLGGDEGALLVREADAWLVGQGVVDRERWLAVHAPGF